MQVAGSALLLLLLPAVLRSAPSTATAATDLSPSTVHPEPTTELDLDITTEADRSEDLDISTETYDYIDDNDTLKTDLIFEKIKGVAELHRTAFAIVYKVAAVVKKLWRFLLDVAWKPLLKLYISPLRLIHTYLLPELISAECFNVYHGDVHRYENPLQPYRPNKLELVKCIFQYLGHYVRSWQFVNRIEDNNYNLVK